MSDQIKELGEKAEKQKEELKKRIAEIEAQQKQYEDKLADSLNAPSVFTPSRSGNSFEARTLKAFGARSPKDLLEINVADPRFSKVDYSYKSAAIELKKTIDNARWIAQIFHGERKDTGMVDVPVAVKGIFDHAYGRDVLLPLVKSFDSGVSSTGGAWVPTAISTRYEEEMELEKKWISLIPQVQMTTNPWKLPVQSNVTKARIVAEKATMTDANFQTSTIDFDAFKLGEFYCLGTELTEDSAPQILSIASDEVVEAQMRAREDILANGDSTGPHMDSDTAGGAADLAVKAVKGFRKLALENTANGGDVDFGAAAITTAKLDEMRTNMGKFGVNPRDLIYVFGPSGYNQAIALDEVTSVDKFGGQATILTGSLAAFRGIPVVVSEFVREDLANTGVYDGVTTDKTVVYLFNKKRFYFGIRRPIRSRVMLDLPHDDQWLLASYSRIDFKGHAQSASEVSAVVGRSVLV